MSSLRKFLILLCTVLREFVCCKYTAVSIPLVDETYEPSNIVVTEGIF